MKGFKSIILYIVGFLLVCGIILFCISGCDHKVGKTEIMVQDSIRHYRPVLQGQELILKYRIANVGKSPLVIVDLYTSAGCEPYDNPEKIVVLPNKETTLFFRFDSSKFSGYVDYDIYIYGNMVPHNYAVLKFDVNVVPQYNSSVDYEERYYENERTDYLINGVINGFENQREYYINSGDYPDDYSKNYKRYPWREIEEEIK